MSISAPTNLPDSAASESNLGWILGVSVIAHVIAIVFVGLRIYTRVAVVKTFGRDDVMLLLAIVSSGCLISTLP